MTQSDLRTAKRLPFCYLCRRRFKPKDEKNEDHVPNTAIFDPADRDAPLKLPVHSRCHDGASKYDEEIGQLVALLHGKRPRPERRRLRITDSSRGKYPYRTLTLGLPRIIWRWVRGFHAALYHEYLPSTRATRDWRVHPPLAGPTGRGPERMIDPPEILAMHRATVHVIKKHRTVERVDRIICRKGKCCYECVWEQWGSRWRCYFALDLYDWKRLGSEAFEQRGCVGSYERKKPPAGCSVTTDVELPFANRSPLDPFGP